MAGIADAPFCNDSAVPLRVPGFGIDLRFKLPPESRFTSPFDDLGVPYLTARELAVLRAINVITDKPDWAAVVLRSDKQQMAAWQVEARSELIDDSTWDWNMLEVRDKAAEYISTGHALVFNSGAHEFFINHDTGKPIGDLVASGYGVCKSDSLISDSIIMQLQQYTAGFFKTGNVPLGLSYQVDPSLFPLVFNRTPVIQQPGQTVQQIIDNREPTQVSTSISTSGQVLIRDKYGLWRTDSYSTVYQWLPCEVEFSGAEESNDVRITSYINNSDPTRFKGLYHSIEQVVSRLLDPWNEVLVKAGVGRTPPRIHTYGVDYHPRRLYRTECWTTAWGNLGNPEKREAAIDYIKRFMAIPGYSDSASRFEMPRNGWEASEWRTKCCSNGYHDMVRSLWLDLRTCDLHPKIGDALTYHDWKTNQLGACVVPPITCKDVMATSDPHLTFRGGDRVQLKEQFHDKGLQIIVKLASIKLTPAEPVYTDHDWSIEGVHNEHIVGVGMLCYSIENVADARLAFRYIGGYDSSLYDYDYEDMPDMEELFALESEEETNSCWFQNTQKLGSVAIKPGRLMAYPNHMQTKFEHVQLEDKSRPGHLHYLVICLVDPHYRICSTRNVQPQQPEYWIDAALRECVPSHVSLPQEINDSIAAYAKEGWPIPMSEAIELSRLKRQLPNLVKGEKWGICDC